MALIQVVNYLKELAGNPVFMEKYKALAAVVKEASAGNGQDLTPEILKLKDEIKIHLLESDPVSWGFSSYSLFEKINSNRLFGKPAAEFLENLVNHGSRDYKTMYSELNRTIKLWGKFADDITRFSNLFGLILPAEELVGQEKDPGKASMLLYFEGRLSVQSISDLERYSRLWDGILDSFCRLSGEEKPSVEISSFNNGRIVLDVTAGEKTLKSIISGVDGIISCLSDIVRINVIRNELVHIPLRHDMNHILSEEIGFLVEDKACEIAEQLAAEITPAQHDDYVIQKISLSLKQVLSFIEKGGKIEYNSAHADQSILKNLTEAFRKAFELDQLANAFEQAKKLQPVKNDHKDMLQESI